MGNPQPTEETVLTKAKQIAWDDGADLGQDPDAYWRSLDHEAHCYYRELAESELITFGMMTNLHPDPPKKH